MYTLHLGNSLTVLPTVPSNSIDAIVCDPPYELGFMGKSWDASGIAYNLQLWQEALRVLKPGGHLLAFSGSRTYHRMSCAIEDAGFEIRDQIMWVYGSGFPKSMDVSKAIDKAAGAEREVIGKADRKASFGSGESYEGKRSNMSEIPNITAPATKAAKQWQGWGTALKPAHEPICVARKPLAKGFTVAANVLEYSTGALNIDGCRVEGGDVPEGRSRHGGGLLQGSSFQMPDSVSSMPAGRWPANLIHDGLTEEWARFFYCAKTGKKDRNEGCEALPQKTGGMVSNTSGQHITRRDEGYTPPPQGNNHPTVKPTDLMRYLCRMVTPPGGTVLDPFMGSGSTGKAAMLEGFRFTGIEMSEEYMAIAAARIEAAFETTIADMI